MAAQPDRPDPQPEAPWRRDLLKGASAAAGCGAIAVAAWPAARFVAAQGPAHPPSGEVLICADSALPPGQMRIARIGTRAVAVLRRHDGTLSAFDPGCTHLGCIVRFRPEDDGLHCGCHGAVFDAKTGAVRKGPASSPLPLLELEIRDGRIYIRA